MHGMNNFGLISRMITDWAYPRRWAIHRRLETRWVKPVKPGDTIQPIGIIEVPEAGDRAIARWVLIDVLVRNQNDEKVATGEGDGWSFRWGAFFKRYSFISALSELRAVGNAGRLDASDSRVQW